MTRTVALLTPRAWCGFGGEGRGGHYISSTAGWPFCLTERLASPLGRVVVVGEQEGGTSPLIARGGGVRARI